VPRAASASIPPLLCETTTRAAIAFAVRHVAASGASSAPAAALAQEVLNTMLVHKLKLAAMSLLLLTTVAAGTGYLARSLGASALPREGGPPGEPQRPAARTEPRPPDPPRPSGERMTVAGQVLDPDGKPVRGAVVDLLAVRRSPWVGASDEVGQYTLLSQGPSDSDGRYRLDAPRTASISVLDFYALATAPGYGIGWAALNPDAEQPGADIRLQPEQIIRARLIEVTGAPAKNVEVRVQSLSRANDQGKREGKRGDGIWVWSGPPAGMHAWPTATTTDDQGRIVLPGIGRGVNVGLAVRDLRYARQELYIDSDQAMPPKETMIALVPARIIEGRVLAADTGRPIPNAVVSATGRVMNERTRGFVTSKFRADDQGRFVMNPTPVDSYTLGAFPVAGEPYLIQQDEFPWPRGAIKATRDIKLRRGVLIRGKVTEQGSGRPLAASSIQFIPVRRDDRVLSGWQAIVASRDDGSFEIAVPPGKGHLLVFGPTPDYILGEIGSGALYDDRSVRSTRGTGGIPNRAHAIIPYEAKAGGPPLEVDAALRRGATVKGRVEGPDGQTVTDAFILTTLHTPAINPTWRGDFHVAVRDGRFELHGVDPERTTRIYLLGPEHEWGATVDLSGKSADADLTIRLQPCGRATARFVGPDGKPIAGYRPMPRFVAPPSPTRDGRREPDRSEPIAESDYLANVDRKHYWNLPRADAEGRYPMVSLIPGALYQIVEPPGTELRREFSVKPGEMLDLGEIVIERPEAQ
jgi:hypothetical protein